MLIVLIGLPLFAVLVSAVIKCVYYLYDCKKYGKDKADELQTIYKKMGI